MFSKLPKRYERDAICMQEKLQLRIWHYATEHRHELKWKRRLHALMYAASNNRILRDKVR